VRTAAQQVLSRLQMGDPLLDITMRLGEIAPADEYFIERRLYPNVDFCTGLICKAMGLPTRMFTVLFASAGCPAGSPSGGG